VKRRRRLLVILLIGTAALWLLWLTRRFWLPWLAARVPATSTLLEISELLQGFDALINLTMGAVNAILSFLALRGSTKPTKMEGAPFPEAVQRTTGEQIRESLGVRHGSRVKWVDRGAVAVHQLKSSGDHGRLVIVGRMKVGKTREAAELIRRAVKEELVSEDQIFEPSSAFHYVSSESLRHSVSRQLDAKLPILLFVQDLPKHFYGERLDRLDAVLQFLKDECKASYVLADARADQLTDSHSTWLSEKGFLQVELPALDADQVGLVVDRAALVIGLQVDEAARKVFMTTTDGTPALPILALQRLKDELKDEETPQVNEQAARRVCRATLEETWSSARGYIEENEPAAVFILQSLAVFHAAGVRPFESTVMHYAAHLMGTRPAIRRRLRGELRLLRGALAYLEHFGIETRQDVIRYPEYVVEGHP